MTSYQRLIVHRVADYFLLHHLAVDREPGKRGVVLMKHAGSRMYVPGVCTTELLFTCEQPCNSIPRAG